MFRVQGSGTRVQGSGFRVQGSGFRVSGVGCRAVRGVEGMGARVIERRGGVEHRLRGKHHHLQVRTVYALTVYKSVHAPLLK